MKPLPAMAEVFLSMITFVVYERQSMEGYGGKTGV